MVELDVKMSSLIRIRHNQGGLMNDLMDDLIEGGERNAGSDILHRR